MILNRLVYVSTPADGVSVSTVAEIVRGARIKNMKKSIFGYLCANSDYFIQCLEGDEALVNALYKNIAKDPRHHSIELKQCEPCQSHFFSQWNMGVMLDLSVHKEILDNYLKEGQFNPYLLNSLECICLLREFSELKNIKNNSM